MLEITNISDQLPLVIISTQKYITFIESYDNLVESTKKKNYFADVDGYSIRRSWQQIKIDTQFENDTTLFITIYHTGQYKNLAINYTLTKIELMSNQCTNRCQLKLGACYQSNCICNSINYTDLDCGMSNFVYCQLKLGQFQLETGFYQLSPLEKIFFYLLKDSLEEQKNYDLSISLSEGKQAIVSKLPALKSNYPSIDNGVNISYTNDSCEFNNFCYHTNINQLDYLWTEVSLKNYSQQKVLTIYNPQKTSITIEIQFNTESYSDGQSVFLQVIILGGVGVFLIIVFSGFCAYKQCKKSKKKKLKEQEMLEMLQRQIQHRQQQLRMEQQQRRLLNSYGPLNHPHIQQIDLDPFLPLLKKEDIENILGDDIMECSICLSELDDKCRMLFCFHVFHKECLDQWLPEHLTCPYCREFLDFRLLESKMNIFLGQLMERKRKVYQQKLIKQNAIKTNQKKLEIHQEQFVTVHDINSKNIFLQIYPDEQSRTSNELNEYSSITDKFQNQEIRFYESSQSEVSNKSLEEDLDNYKKDDDLCDLYLENFHYEFNLYNSDDDRYASKIILQKNQQFGQR